MHSWDVGLREERRHKNGTRDQRTEFERDRDRLLYSSAFHRLAGITQIVRAGEANVFHTRQQHSIKVAQVGRRLAQKLLKEQPEEAAFRGLDPEVVEAACIAHDLGHPPFGHIGEHTLNELVIKNDDDGFEGNAQSFRIITKLAIRFPDVDGIDMTRATLAACLKYPWYRQKTGKAAKKWSVYRSEAEDFDFARAHHRGHSEKTLEAELMDWADDVAYSVHDLEDFHRCNALPWQKVFAEKEKIIAHALGGSMGKLEKERVNSAYDRLKGFLEGTYSELLSEPYEGAREQREQLRRMTSQLIGTYINSIKINPDRSSNVAVEFDQDRVDEVRILKQITRDYIIGSPTLAAQQYGQQKIIRDLFDALTSSPESATGYPTFLPVRLRYLRPMAGTSPARFVSDCISSLSEAEAVALHSRLTGSVTGSVLDPIVR
ncbi:MULTISPECIES: dGTP triphosphohydrolase [unclassified Rhizobium]|uniref:deoxyguanosinetriphosphate triphosphohydrolase family protein n=1 Tax=unclassified Rhizobium TaxID=2613769 RepID=UPI000BE8E6CA|nr:MULTISPECIES: dNTP triphosphohydrolase [unclassified Rhizobium]MDF0659275.1 dNTP triphosphohydrolase [Rhizobium sp. BC49]PDS83258.1 deoxyguanosinetriphosphate triphosphohydrolase [Rhizobium sp. L18]